VVVVVVVGGGKGVGGGHTNGDTRLGCAPPSGSRPCPPLVTPSFHLSCAPRAPPPSPQALYELPVYQPQGPCLPPVRPPAPSFPANGTSSTGDPLAPEPLCFASQPPQSLHREQSWGWGLLTVGNASAARWQWHALGRGPPPRGADGTLNATALEQAALAGAATTSLGPQGEVTDDVVLPRAPALLEALARGQGRAMGAAAGQPTPAVVAVVAADGAPPLGRRLHQQRQQEHRVGGAGLRRGRAALESFAAQQLGQVDA
jgi:hypothetical protein